MLTETAAKNMAVLTLDRKYAQRRDRVMKLKANDAKTANVLKGFESGMLKLINGVLEGVTGVVSKPIRGAERDGFEGFAKGIGKGLLGLVVKPVIGTTDLLTDTLIGVKGSVDSTRPQGLSTVQGQIRPRRALYGRDRVVRPYRIDDATAATIQSRSRLGGEEYLSHVDMVSSVALFSYRKLLVLSQDGEELLLLMFKEIDKVEVQQPEEGSSGCNVVIYLNDSEQVTDDKKKEVEKKVVKCEDEKIANMFCEELRKVINSTAR